MTNSIEYAVSIGMISSSPSEYGRLWLNRAVPKVPVSQSVCVCLIISTYRPAEAGRCEGSAAAKSRRARAEEK